MAFYEFDQNNSGGVFSHSENAFSAFVIVEAPNARAANALAESLGLYFDGSGDCSCCGSRWSSAWSDSDGNEKPSHYGTPVHELKRGSMDWSWMARDGKPEGYIHYLNGAIEAVWFDEPSAVRVETVKAVESEQADKELAA